MSPSSRATVRRDDGAPYSSMTRRARRLAAIQGGYFVVSGLWPIVHLRSFEVVTGPKPEGWLVKIVGAMITVTGAVLLDAARRGHVDHSARQLAIGSAAVLGGMETYYALRKRIAPVYFADAVVEAALLLGWARASAKRSDEHAGRQ